MTPEQGTIYGGWDSYPTPPPRHLTGRQRDLLRCVRRGTPVTFTTREARLFFADPSGAMRRLEDMGLVERVARGRWRAT